MTTHALTRREHREPKFPLGGIEITRSVSETLFLEEILRALIRHASGDWGEVDRAGCEENDVGVHCGFRLFSVYHAHDQTEFWIITTAARDKTTVLFPDDY